MNEETLLEKIKGINRRLKQLKLQGESSSNKTLKSMRTRRNRAIKELVGLLTPETSYYNEMKEIKLNEN